MLNKTIAIFLVITSLVSMMLSGCAGETAPSGQTFEVKRGDLDIVVSPDGSLIMPNTFNLRFGTAGKVLDSQVIERQGGDITVFFGTTTIPAGIGTVRPLVQEGDIVKQGSILAFLDTTAQKNAIRTALLNMQTTVNSITTGVCGSLTDLPNNYPNLSAPLMFQEAQKDLDDCAGYFNKGQYKDAGFSLALAYFDIEVCQDLIATRVNPAVLAGAKVNTIYYPDGDPGTNSDMWPSDAKVIDYLEKYQAKLLNISWLMRLGSYTKAKSDLITATQEMLTGSQLVENTLHIKGRTYLTYPDIPTSLDFLQSSMRSLQDLGTYMAQGDATQEEIAKRLYTSKFNLSTGNDVLQDQTLIYDWTTRSDWKTMQQYNLNVQNAQIAFYKAKRDIMNTVIIAPVDGIVVSVALKQGAILSAQDYSSRTAITLVDTSTVKFTGLVDEIDIMKVKTGQKAKIKVDAIPDKEYTGAVKFISPFGTKQGQVMKFAVTILLDQIDANLRGGLSATADINVYSAKNVLVIPVSVIIQTPSGPVVMVINEATGQAEQRSITLGKQSLQFAEVTSGLKEGERIQVLSQKPATQAGTQQRPPAPPGLPH